MMRMVYQTILIIALTIIILSKKTMMKMKQAMLVMIAQTQMRMATAILTFLITIVL
jgi:hypothetical protein